MRIDHLTLLYQRLPTSDICHPGTSQVAVVQESVWQYRVSASLRTLFITKANILGISLRTWASMNTTVRSRWESKIRGGVTHIIHKQWLVLHNRMRKIQRAAFKGHHAATHDQRPEQYAKAIKICPMVAFNKCIVASSLLWCKVA